MSTESDITVILAHLRKEVDGEGKLAALADLVRGVAGDEVNEVLETGVVVGDLELSGDRRRREGDLGTFKFFIGNLPVLMLTILEQSSSSESNQP